jgi:hypothetical protein
VLERRNKGIGHKVFLKKHQHRIRSKKLPHFSAVNFCNRLRRSNAESFYLIVAEVTSSELNDLRPK